MKEEKYKPYKEITHNNEPLDYEPVDLPGDEPEEQQHYLELLILFIAAIASAFLMCYMDKGTGGIADLFDKQMILVALIYAVPAFATSAFIFEKIIKFYDKKMSLLLSWLIAIPLVFLLMMMVL